MSKTLGTILAGAAALTLMSLAAAPAALAHDRCDRAGHRHHAHHAHHHHHHHHHARHGRVTVVAPFTRVHTGRHVHVRAPFVDLRVARCRPCER